MILICGATGNVGNELTQILAEHGSSARALIHDPDKASLVDKRLDLKIGNLEEPASMTAAMKDITTIFLLVTDDSAHQAKNVLNLAKQHQVKHIVYLSSIGAAAEPPLQMDIFHNKNELLLRRSDFSWTIIRSGFMMSNCLPWAETIQSEGKVYDGFGDGEFAPIDPYDVAAVAAAILLDPSSHQGRTYQLTGKDLTSVPGQVKILSKVLSRPIDYVEKTPKEMADIMQQTGMPPEFAEGFQESMERTRRNEFTIVTDTVDSLTGSQPHSFENWCKDHADSFQ